MRATTPLRTAPQRGRRVTFSVRDGVEQAQHILERLRQHQGTGAITASVARLCLALAAQSSQRLKMGMAGLLLLEAFCAYILLIHLVADLTASPFGNPQPPNDTGLAFATIVVLPALLLTVRSQYTKTRACEAEREREALHRLRQAGTDLARAYAILYLQPGAPLEIAQAAYTAAMKRAHPDLAGGDTAAAAELNWAIATIRDHDRAQGSVR